MFRRLTLFLLTLAAAVPASQPLSAQTASIDTTLYRALQWRNIGPFRGGRAVAAAGVPSRPETFYLGATGGGVWRTEDAGVTWKNISDGYFATGSVGAIAVAPSDPNVIYVGMGEHPVRGVTTSHGDGVYRSMDAGRTWTHIGLDRTRQISRIRVHPTNPDLVYIAAQGSPFGPTEERGIYRSRDGGANWDRVHFVSQDAGASDLSMDVTNPRILYAAYWDHRRFPWQVRSGGPGSGIWKSTDGGDTWNKLEQGLPSSMGKTSVDVSSVDPDLVWAIIEADEGGLFKSEDAGKTWKRTSDDRLIRARAWYYIEVNADPQDRETVYVLNAPLTRSVDGGRTFTVLNIPHGDTHDLWINPNDHEVMLLADDGGGTVTTNGGKTWSTQNNQPTAQFYRVNTDNRFPYWVYGGQQDNNSVAIMSRNPSGPGIGWKDWFDGPGCESAYIAFDPNNPRYLYGGCYQGILSEMDTETGYQRDVMAYPTVGLGSTPREEKYRFNWNAPLITSPHDPTVMYHGGNVLLRTSDRGNTWTEVSSDLTRDETDKQGPGGAPITNEAAGGEVYNTIFTVAESPRQRGLIWVGSDDGLVHVTRDGGTTWTNVTPEDLPESQVNAIEASPHSEGTAYVAVTRYKFNDFTPLIYRTHDFGATWDRVVSGIKAEAWVRVVREDPTRSGLLYAGTETGAYVSFNDGDDWQTLQTNLPVVPVTDLKVQGTDLVAATQGRAFWILQDLTLLRQLHARTVTGGLTLTTNPVVYRIPGGGGFSPNVPGLGANPPSGAMIYAHLSKTPDSAGTAKLEILDGAGGLVRTYVTKREKGPDGLPLPSDSIALKEGMNRVRWDLRHQGPTPIQGLFSLGSPNGRFVRPGTYHARLSVGGETASATMEVVPDPRHDYPPAAYVQQETVARAIQGHISDLLDYVRKLRRAKDQVASTIVRAAGRPEHEEIKAAGDSLTAHLTKAEERLVQPKSKTFQDVVNFTSQLDAQWMALLQAVDGAEPPLTSGQRTRFRDLEALWTTEKSALDKLLGAEVNAFNTLVRDRGVPAVVIPERP
jgi:photosystem II stability/assembly factor-like uncharacterized protein